MLQKSGTLLRSCIEFWGLILALDLLGVEAAPQALSCTTLLAGIVVGGADSECL